MGAPPRNAATAGGAGGGAWRAGAGREGDPGQKGRLVVPARAPGEAGAGGGETGDGAEGGPTSDPTSNAVPQETRVVVSLR